VNVVAVLTITHAGDAPAFLVFRLFHEQNELPAVGPAFAEFAAISHHVCHTLRQCLPVDAGDAEASPLKLALANQGVRGAGGNPVNAAIVIRYLELLTGKAQSLDKLAPFVQSAICAVFSIDAECESERTFLESKGAQARAVSGNTAHGKGDGGVNSVTYQYLSWIGACVRKCSDDAMDVWWGH
jgi:hypothetical protein